MVRAMDLNKNSVFVWQNRMYVVVDTSFEGDFTFISVKSIAAYWTEPRNEWVFNPGQLEKFNGYCPVDQVNIFTPDSGFKIRITVKGGVVQDVVLSSGDRILNSETEINDQD